MFKFLKEKIKSSISKISKKLEREEVKEEPIKEKEKPITEIKEEPKEIKEEKPIEEIKKEPEKKSIIKKVTEKISTTKINQDKFNELFQDLELTLLENNVALEITEKIKQDLSMDLVDVPIKRKEITSIVKDSLRESLEELFSGEKIDLLTMLKNKKEKPFVIVFFGVNGSGKTTTIAKIAHLCLTNKLSVALGAGDCFRKAAIEQLEEWGKRLGIKVIKHQYGSDPAAVCFDTLAFGKSHNIDVVLLDTAGRQHSNENLMNELNKIKRVAKPDLSIFIAESIAGNDAVEQAKSFNEAIGIDGIILTKSDVDEKGGAIISTEYITHKPILYLGNGQNVDDLKEFNSKEVIASIGIT